MKNNYGLKFEPIKPEDYILSGFTNVPKEVLQPDGQWSEFLPVAENQAKGAVEPSSCVSMTTDNCAEIILKKKYGGEYDLSDRFLAKISNTQNGNTPQAVAQAFKNSGNVKEEVWAFSPEIDSLEKYYSEIPQEVKDKAKKFLDEYDFLHEYCLTAPEALKEGLTMSPLGIGVPAWYLNEQGLYYRPEGLQDNHFTTLIGYVDGKYWIVFDSYENNIKHLDWNINSSVAKRFWIKKKDFYPEPETNWVKDLIISFSSFIRAIFGI